VDVRCLVNRLGKPYSLILGIDLKGGKEEEMQKWLLASLLYSHPIREETATRTYAVFDRLGLISAQRIVEAGWDSLVAALDQGGYTRYDFSTATRLLEVFGNLISRYRGLWGLYNSCSTPGELESRIKSLGRGIGDVTISIFLRDMRWIWPLAKPKPTPLEKLALDKLEIRDLEGFAKANDIDSVYLETCAVRLGKLIKRGKASEVLDSCKRTVFVRTPISQGPLVEFQLCFISARDCSRRKGFRYVCVSPAGLDACSAAFKEGFADFDKANGRPCPFWGRVRFKNLGLLSFGALLWSTS